MTTTTGLQHPTTVISSTIIAIKGSRLIKVSISKAIEMLGTLLTVHLHKQKTSYFELLNYYMFAAAGETHLRALLVYLEIFSMP